MRNAENPDTPPQKTNTHTFKMFVLQSAVGGMLNVGIEEDEEKLGGNGHYIRALEDFRNKEGKKH